MSDAQPGDKPAEQLKGANDASRPQQPDKYSRPTVPRVEDFGDVVKNDDQDASLEDLVQFLKKTPPPPSNYMSIPDDFSGSSEEDKWDKLKTKVFRRPSKTRKKPPPRIMLPDSAVAATTIGGYRYIAISIPTERSALAPISALRCPVDDRLEAAFHRDVNSRFGMWKTLPASRVVTVLNPVPEDRRESMSSGSLPSIASDRPEQATALSDPAMRKRPHTVSLSPGKERRYNPGKSRGLAKSRSVRDTHPASQISDLTGITRGGEGLHTSKAIISETNQPGPSSRGSHIKTAPTGIGAVGSGTHLVVPEKPVITLTLPSRRSSKRGIRLDKVVHEPIEHVASISQESPPSTSGTNSIGNGDGSGISNRDHARGSFAASIDTTSSSPKLMKAQTAIAFQSVPIVVRASSDDLESPTSPHFAESPAGKGEAEGSVQTPAGGPPPPLPSDVERSQSRKKRTREKKRRDTEKKGKGKEPASQPFGFAPGMPAAFPKVPPAAILGHHAHGRHQREDDDSSSPSSSSRAGSSDSTRDRGKGRARASSYASQKEQRQEREARYVAKALAEERETLESLPRDELIRRYEALREQRIYEREKRLRRLERSRDSWVRAVPVLLQDLNVLLREQHRILESAGLTHAFREGLSQHRHERHHRPRSRSVEVSSSSFQSNRSLDLLEARRTRSLHSSSESRSVA